MRVTESPTRLENVLDKKQENKRCLKYEKKKLKIRKVSIILS